MTQVNTNEAKGNTSAGVKNFADLGGKRGKELVTIDKKAGPIRATMKSDLQMILKEPQESWPTYVTGIRDSIKDAEKAGQDCGTAKVIASQVARFFNAAKTQFTMVKALVDGPDGWKKMLKQLPKGNAGKPETKKDEQTTPGTSTPLSSETNAGNLLLVIEQAAQRLQKLGAERKELFCEFMGVSILEELKNAHGYYAAEHTKYTKDGVTNWDKFREHLDMIPKAETAEKQAA